MAIKHGRFGAFLGCTKFPECRTTHPLRKEIGVSCPLCEKPVVERKTKAGRLFYGCSDYPACNFISWNKPTGELCPVCGTFLVEKKYKNQASVVECSNNECPTRGGGRKEPETDAKTTRESPKPAVRPVKKTPAASKAGQKPAKSTKSARPSSKAGTTAKTRPAATKQRPQEK